MKTHLAGIATRALLQARETAQVSFLQEFCSTPNRRARRDRRTEHTNGRAGSKSAEVGSERTIAELRPSGRDEGSFEGWSGELSESLKKKKKTPLWQREKKKGEKPFLASLAPSLARRPSRDPVL